MAAEQHPTQAGTGDGARLSAYLDVWWQACQELLATLETLEDDEWRRPTDLPGWDLHAVVAHVAHLESLLAGGEHDDVEIGEPPHVRNAMGTFTEQGVVARRGRRPEELIAEIGVATAARRAATQADPPTDPAAPAPGAFGAIGWDTETLLANRPLDVHMHHLDILRALGRPIDADTATMRHTVQRASRGFARVVGKDVAPPAGTTAVLSVTGFASVAVQVDGSGRAHSADDRVVPDVRLSMDAATYVALAGGRRGADRLDVTVEGDAALGEAILARMATTP